MRVIREMTMDDLESVKKIYESAFERPEGILMYYPYFSEYVDFCIKQRYAYIAVEDNVVCGVLLAYEKPDMHLGKSVYIELLAVLPEYQKKGIGTGFLNRVKAEALNNGIMEMSLRTGCYMDSYQMYKNYGFRDTRDDHRFMVMNIRKSSDEEENEIL